MGAFWDGFKTDLGLEIDRFSSAGELVEATHHTICYYNQERIQTTLRMPPAKYRILHEEKVLENLFENLEARLQKLRSFQTVEYARLWFNGYILKDGLPNSLIVAAGSAI